MSAIQITCFRSGPPPIFDAEWRGKAVSIQLDASAAMMLTGDSPFSERDDLIAGAATRVAHAAQWLVGHADSAGHQSISITLSALDLS